MSSGTRWTLPAAAQASGVQLSTLRICRDLGLLEAGRHRTQDGAVRSADVQESRLVSHLLREEGLNPAGVRLARRLLELAEREGVRLGGEHRAGEELQAALSAARRARAGHRGAVAGAVDPLLEP